VHADQAADQADGNAAEGAQAEACHVEQADDASALVGGRIDLDQGLRHGVEGQFEESRGKQEAERERIVVRQREDRKRGAPQLVGLKPALRAAFSAPTWRPPAALADLPDVPNFSMRSRRRMTSCKKVARPTGQIWCDLGCRVP
jgi:hypothetical protein